MIKQIRTSKASRVIACYLALMIFLQITQPIQMFALTEGPSQPEFNSFTPIGTSDMVDLTSGDFNYNIPIMDVGGYPINLAYNSGVTMDQEASWVGLGWNLNIGQINRNVRGLPDDFRGDKLITDNNLKPNVTIGVNPYLNAQIIGALDGPALSFGAGLDVQYNNYKGLSAVPSFGPSFKISDYVTVGMQLSSSTDEGVSISPSVSLSAKDVQLGKDANSFSGTASASVTYNSRQGLQSFNLSTSIATDTGNKYLDGGLSGLGGSSAGATYIRNTFTPTKRLAFKNNNIRFSFSAGPNFWGGHAELSIAGYASVQKLINKHQEQKSYGYEHTQAASLDDLLDFNREKEQSIVTQNTLVLPVTNYTYDIYSIQGQGVGGTFRPFRGQIGQVFDALVVDQSSSMSAGLEVELGTAAHKGLNFRKSTTTSYTGNWETKASPFFKEKVTKNAKDYEMVYFKNIGESRNDIENTNLLETKLGGKYPITLMLDINKDAINVYGKKQVNNTTTSLLPGTPFVSQIKRNNREQRNQVIQKITKNDAIRYRLAPFINYNTDIIIDNTSNLPIAPLAPGHHTAGYIVTDQNGNKSIFGETVYNKSKEEASFNVGSTGFDPDNGLIKYSAQDNSSSNSSGRDHYYNSVKTPAYAHTYLISSALSPDYKDLTGNGPTDDDLGSYTKFIYQKTSADYKWRVPYGKKNQSAEDENPEKWASFNEGLKTDRFDQKASYIYGTKENKYIKTIITKTHVAIFELGERKDGYGVNDKDGGGNSATTSKMYRLKTIKLYSKPDGILLLDSNPSNDAGIYPIKTAYFEYSYKLCKGIDNNFDVNPAETGKLTLDRVYFTYKNSNMGKYTPYIFDYGDPDDYNPDYNVKAYDIWGNFKPFEPNSFSINSNKTTPQEFPYVDQTDKTQQNKYAASWSLQSIQLPSGGKIKLEYESDDYKYVQDQKAMRMFKIDGVTHDPTHYNGALNNNVLYSGLGTTEATHVAVKLTGQEAIDAVANPNLIINKYTEGLYGKAIYFNFLLNMTSNSTDYDYVTGYFEMGDPNDTEEKSQVIINGGFIFIPMKHISQEGGTSGDKSNPISVAGWFFGRENLNSQINDLPDPNGNVPSNIIDMGKSIWDNLKELSLIFKGANERLKGKGCAKVFKPHKSWIRLLEPSGAKLGGGARVTKVALLDEWDKMVDVENNSDLDRYAKQYGQQYDYKLEDGITSSGVASYEPNISKENPLIVPFYHKAEKLTGQSYQEKPFGESFFPSPTVTYSRVTVTNINASDAPTRTGKVVTQHYTTKDFPTLTDFTDLPFNKNFQSNEESVTKKLLKSMLGIPINIKNKLTMAQGFVVETNDMNGKLKKQEVFNNANALISSVEYKYNTKPHSPESPADTSVLDNKVPTIDEKGAIALKEIGTQFDVVNDFRESYSLTNSKGAAINIDVIPIGPFPLIIGWSKPESAKHEQILRMATTTKVIHKTGILKETIAFDLGSTVHTKNHAWDPNTGQILLTETINEFDDKYYSFNFPAYWRYAEMGMESNNVDIKGTFASNPITDNDETFFRILDLAENEDISKYLHIGDELLISQSDTKRYWVTGYYSDNEPGPKTHVSLIRSNGTKVTSLNNDILNGINRQFRVINSSYGNVQMASMASITLMKNPIYEGPTLLGNIDSRFNKTNVFDPKIINASAVEYNDEWASQCENNLPQPEQTDFNKYLYNVKGLWRPVRSYAYLTGRNVSATSNTRHAGFFNKFVPFYRLNSEKWVKNDVNNNLDFKFWTFASEVTKYNPYGVEIENKDALKRYSSAQYGYNYKFPVAVASNSTYQEMGFDGFEDYLPSNWSSPSAIRKHFGFNQDITTDNTITDQESHTGKKSVVVKSGNKVKMKRKIGACIPSSEN